MSSSPVRESPAQRLNEGPGSEEEQGVLPVIRRRESGLFSLRAVEFTQFEVVHRKVALHSAPVLPQVDSDDVLASRNARHQFRQFRRKEKGK